MSDPEQGDRPVHPHIDKSALYNGTTHYEGAAGMTLREHYAGLAMNGLLSRSAHHHPAEIAPLAVRCAAALLAALEKTNG